MYDYFNWYDYEEVEKLNDKYSKQWLRLHKKRMDARDKGDEATLKKTMESIRKHEAKGQMFKQKAEEAGYCWV
jgi:hypothetical protein